MGGKLCQMLISNLYNFHTFFYHSSQYVMLCVILNTVGEEMLATTFVNVLGKVFVVSYSSHRSLLHILLVDISHITTLPNPSVVLWVLSYWEK